MSGLPDLEYRALPVPYGGGRGELAGAHIQGRVMIEDVRLMVGAHGRRQRLKREVHADNSPAAGLLLQAERHVGFGEVQEVLRAGPVLGQGDPAGGCVA